MCQPRELINSTYDDNPEPICPCILLLDVSDSMNNRHEGLRAIDQLNNSLGLLKDIILSDELASVRVQLAVVTFGGNGVEVIQNFTSVDKFEPSHLHAFGGTPLGAALYKALDMIREWKANYPANKPSYYKPWLVVFTDGDPNDQGWENAVKLVHQAEYERKGVNYFVFGVQPIRIDTLKQISPSKLSKERKQSMLLLEDHEAFREIFQWLGGALSVVSNSNADMQQVELPVLPQSTRVITVDL